MASIDSSVIIENLTELLTNTVNMTSVFYDIFLNPEPMDVELQQYNSDGEIITITIPNRAKDRQIAIVGEGDPNGVIEANIGACYVDETDQAIYFKASGSGSTGWVVIPAQTTINSYIRTYLSTNGFVTESDVDRYLNDNNYVTSSDVSAILGNYTPVIKMVPLTSVSGTQQLADNTAYSISANGNISFSLPSSGDLDSTILHKIFVQFYMGNVYTVTLGTNYYFDNIAPNINAIGMYNIMYEFDNTTGLWVVGVMRKGTA